MKFQYRTDRLLLRIVDSSAAPLVADFLSRNRADFDRWERYHNEAYYTAEYQKRTLQAEQRLLLRLQGVRFYVFLKNLPDNIIGTVSFTYLTDDSGHQCRIGYKFDRNCRGQGYAYEAIHFLINIIFKEFSVKRIEADIMPANYRSIRLIEKLGFKFEGIARESHEVLGREENHNRYSLPAQDL